VWEEVTAQTGALVRQGCHLAEAMPLVVGGHVLDGSPDAVHTTRFP